VEVGRYTSIGPGVRAYNQNHPLEWTHRLLAQPRQLWRRYIFGLPALAWMLLVELSHLGARSPRA
jgi:hypothetical protein